MSPDDLQLLASLVQAGRVTREQAAWLQAEVGRRGVPLGALLAEKGIGAPAGAGPLARTVAAPPPRLTPTPPGGVPLASTVAAPAPGGAATPGPRPDLSIGLEHLPPDVQAALADPACRIGRYALLGELGRGAMGVVLRAHDTVVGRAVAIKLLLGDADAQAVERFKREVAAAGTLRHESIVALLEVGLHQGRPFLVMELVEGTNLEELLAAPGGLPLPRALGLLRKVALALDHAHAKGIVHRDVKPANILVDREDVPRLTDFGIARLASSERLTQTGQVIGTPTTLAPEQAAGEHAKHGPPADVYALGSILYRAATGRPPFLAASLQAQLAAILFERPTPPRERAPGLDPRLDALILRCLEKEPADRPSAVEVAADLGRILAAPPPSRPPAALVAGLAALVVVVSAVGGVVVARGRLAPTTGPSPVGAARPPTEPGPSPAAPAPSPAPTGSSPATPGPRPGSPLSAPWTSRRSEQRALVLRAQVGSVAWRNGTPVGRLAATPDRRHVWAVGLSSFRRFDVESGGSLDLECRLAPEDDRAPDVDPPNYVDADWAEGVAVSADGALAARGDRSGRILVTRDGGAPTALPRVPGRIFSLLFDGERLLAGLDGSVCAVDLATREVTTLLQTPGPVRGMLRLAGDGRIIGVAGSTLLAVVAPPGATTTRDPLPAATTDLAFEPASGQIAISFGGGGPAGAIVGVPPNFIGITGGDKVLGLTFVGPERLAIVGELGQCRLYDLQAHTSLPLAGHRDQAHGVAPVREGFCTGGYDGQLLAWTEAGRRRSGPTTRFPHVTALSSTPDGTHVLTAENWATANDWIPATGEETSFSALGAVDWIAALDDRRAGVWTDHLVIVDLRGEAKPISAPIGDDHGQCMAILGLEDGGALTCHLPGSVVRWDDRATAVRTWAAGAGLRAAALAPDERSLALGFTDGRVTRLDLEASVARAIGAHAGPVRALAFVGPDRVVSAGDDRAARLWRFDAPGDAVWTALGHRRTVEGVAALPDGRVVTSSRDGTVRLWSASGQPLDVLDLCPEDLPTLVVAAPGSRVHVGTYRGLVLTLEVRR